MKNNTLCGIVNYARYHYTTQYKLYLTLVLQLSLIPLFFGIITRDAESAYAMSVAVYIFGCFGLSRILVLPMRERGTKIMEMTLPVTSCERMGFMLLNCVVLYPLTAFVMGALAVTLSTPFNYGEFDLLGQIGEMAVDNYFFYGIYIFIQMVLSGALIINLLARRNLIVSYLISFVVVVVFATLVIRLGLEVLIRFDEYNENIENIVFVSIPQWLGILIYVLIPTTMYGVSYLLLRKRQVKW